ncbi:MAG: hypothetical protein QOI73_604 [Solirubrobacteraceae bacterium]|nr:hypothetical protein [Solirubrobacteraceae bacterium]
MQGVQAYEDFFASHDHMPGGERALRVSGTVVFRTSGWSAFLETTEGNVGINPEILGLDLVLTPPQEGAVTTHEPTPDEVEWSIDYPADPAAQAIVSEYSQVQFRVVGSEDDPPPVLDVAHPE